VFNQLGDVERCALRPGNVHSADGWRVVLEPVVARYRDTVAAVAGQVLALPPSGGFLLSTLIFGGAVTDDVVLSIVLIVAGIILTLRAQRHGTIPIAFITADRSISEQIQLVSYLRSNAFGGVVGKRLN
jgi:hypothetical protein